MDGNQISTQGAVFFMVFTIVYMVLCLFLHAKILKKRIKEAQSFCEQAKLDRRMVSANCCSYKVVHRSDRNKQDYFQARYSYTAPNGESYKTRLWDINFRYHHTPPDDIILYLGEQNHHKYYSEKSLEMGKNREIFMLLYGFTAFIIYLFLAGGVLAPILLP